MATDSIQLRTNRILRVIKDFEYMFPEEFEKCDIKQCGHCKATGLKNRSNMVDFCEHCHGTGYKGYTKILGQYICRNCNGAGCEKCYKGCVDWITHAMGSDLGKENVL